MPMNFQPCGSSVGNLSLISDRLRRIVEVVLDVVVAPDLREFGDVERAVLEGDAVRAVQALGDGLDLALSVLLDDRVDVAGEAGRDEQRALVAEAHRARVGDAGGVELDVEAGRNLQLVELELVGGERDRRRRDRRQLLGGIVVGLADQRMSPAASGCCCAAAGRAPSSVVSAPAASQRRNKRHRHGGGPPDADVSQGVRGALCRVIRRAGVSRVSRRQLQCHFVRPRALRHC